MGNVTQSSCMASPRSQIALILAAGSSTRMGSCKAALPWRTGKTLLTYQVEQWSRAGFVPMVVLAPHNIELKSTLPDPSRVILNPDPTQGKTSSILIGLQEIGIPWNVLAIAAVDQPRPDWIYQTLLREHLQANRLITAPRHEGKLGHPILFCDRMLPHLKLIQEQQLGLRHLMQQFKPSIHPVEFNTPLVLMDLNTPEVYQHAIGSWDG